MANSPNDKMETKPCEQCHAAMHRRRFASGNRESVADWMRRRYCSRDCCSEAKRARWGYASLPACQTERRCAHCDIVLTRRTYDSGYTESWAIFARRRYCSLKCSANHRSSTCYSRPRTRAQFRPGNAERSEINEAILCSFIERFAKIQEMHEKPRPRPISEIVIEQYRKAQPRLWNLCRREAR
jgi:hypothetical protein